MSEIDPEKLEEAIRILRGWWCHGVAETFDFNDKVRIDVVCTAAETLLSTLPRVKEVEVWHTEYAYRQSDGRWTPCVQAHESRADAVAQVENLTRIGTLASVRVTGPHKMRVPA